MNNRSKKSPTLLADILKKSLKNINIEEKIKVYGLWKDWSSIVGEAIASKSRPDYILSSKLYVSVSSPTWLQELTYQKKGLMDKIKQRSNLPQITDIVFRIDKSN